jgi:putative holliday junction resolvase
MSGTAAPQTLLAFDFGTRRTGVAVGNTLLRRAQALTTLAAEGDAVFAQAEPLIREWQPAALVVGIPLHPDGAAHEQTRRAERFARRLAGRFGLPVHRVDERYSTTEALADGARREAADAAAAAILLDQFFRESSAQDTDAAA